MSVIRPPVTPLSGQAGSDYPKARRLAERLIDFMVAGYQLQYHPNGDVSVLVEGRDGVPRDRIIYQPRNTPESPKP